LFLLLFVVFVPVFVYEAVYQYDRYDTRRANELQTNMEVARIVAATFDEFIHDILHQELAMLAIGIHLTYPESLSIAQMNEALKHNNAEYSALRNLAWISPQGHVLASSLSSTIGMDVMERSYFHEIVAGREWYVTDLFLSQATGEPVFTVARGIRDESGSLLGIVAAVVLPDKLGERVSIHRAGEGAITVIERRARAVFRSPRMEWSWEERSIPKDSKAVIDPLEGKEYVGVYECFRDGIDRITAVAPIRSIGWAAVAGRPMDEAMARVKSELVRQVGFFILLSSIVLTLALAISRSIEAPIRRLRDHALSRRMLLEASVDPGGTAELNDLALALREMAEEVRNRESALVESREHFRSLAENSSDCSMRYDAECRHTNVNTACARTAGLPAEEFIGGTHREMGFREELCDAWEEKIRSVFQTGEPQKWEFEFEGSAGRIYLDWHIVPEWSEDGQIKGVLGVSRDVTERVEAQEERKKLEM
jgi:PAS domain S-box-containing protein